jgi:type II secretion system protein F
MPKFLYSVKAGPGKTQTGEVEAESEQEAINRLIKQGYFLISIQAENVYLDKQPKYFRKVSKREIAIFTRQLSSLVESGVNILNSLQIIREQNANKYLKIILNETAAKIKDGKSLSESLSHYPQIFPSLYTSIIHSGEASGNLDRVVSTLADFLEKEEEFRSSLAASLVYPAFISIIGAATVCVLMGFVIPKLVSMFEDLGQNLPLATKILIQTSHFFVSYWWLIFSLLFIAVFSLRRAIKTELGKTNFDKLLLRLPLIGEITLKTEISRLTRTLSLLLASGVAVISSLEIASSVITNQILKNELQKFKEQITTGLSLSKCLSGSAIFPAFVTNIVAVGEEAGSLEKSLMRIANEYEKDVDRSLKSITRMVEPVIILAMGLVVGFIVLSMLLPIFQMNLIVK